MRAKSPKPPHPTTKRRGVPIAAGIKRSLRTLSRAQLTDDDDIAILFDEVHADRSYCIILASMIERHLEQAIIERLRLINKDAEKPLFDREGALSTFFGNIHLGYALGLFSDTVRDDLNVIRRIRNAFAHSSLPITFESPEVSDEIGKLQTRYSLAHDYPDVSEEKKHLSECFLGICQVLFAAIAQQKKEAQYIVTALRFYRDSLSRE
jgi:DNA-binding MltR family transcriptional regulator